MKIIVKDVSYNRGYVIGPYLQERPGVNADISLEEGEDQEECVIKALHYLKSINDRFHKEANPHLYLDMGLDGFVKTPIENPAYINLEEQRQKDALEDQILAATSLNELQLIKEECWKVGLAEQYINKFNQLNNDPRTVL